MKVPPGVLVPADVCSFLGASLLDLLAEIAFRDGVAIPAPVRQVADDVAEVGRAFRRAQAEEPAPDVRSDVRSVANGCSSPADLPPMTTYTTSEAAKRLGLKTARAVQRRAERGTLRAELVGRTWHIDAAQIDHESLAKGA